MVGPFVALGSPEDYLEPIGATRTYAKDQTWKEDFHCLAESAAAFLLEVAGSDSVNWEFEHIRQMNWHERVFLVTRHPSAQQKGYFGWMTDTIRRLKGIPDSFWPEFVENLARLGYHLPVDDPGFGTVIAFDTSAHDIVLTRGADLPNAYVAPILAHLTRAREASL
jgi:hypothetical protein